MTIIVPAPLTDSPSELVDYIKRSEGFVDRFSIDVVDGKFVESKSVLPESLQDVETDLLFDYQLMVIEPIKWVERCVLGQADRIIGHIEHMSDQFEFVAKVQETGRSVGLALDLPTPVSALEETIIRDLDVVLLMSVPAGFGGQKFHHEVIIKIHELESLRKNSEMTFSIHLDGGITPPIVREFSRSGVDEFSIGKRLFDGDLSANIDRYLGML